MIQAQEVRIGNWLLFTAKKPFDFQQYQQVRNIGYDYLLEDHLPEAYYINNSYRECFTGIPLSPELLEAAGFTHRQNIGYRKIYGYGNNTLKCEVTSNSSVAFYWADELLCFLDHLHQLQNLYHSLTGQELPLSLPTLK